MPQRATTLTPEQQLALPRAAALPFFVLTASILAGPSITLAAGANPALICPGDGVNEPQIENQAAGTRIPCNETLLGVPHAPVKIVNDRGAPIFVGFTAKDHKPGRIAWAWGNGCTKWGTGARIAVGASCFARVVSNGVATRFCATLSEVPADCFNAQLHHQTIVETNFEPASNPGCFNKGICVWFDISVIPSNCTDALWKKDRCANTGGASYNHPVAVGCKNVTAYTCRGPTGNKYGPANYPEHCGNPDATCGTPQCLNAYFYPMFDPPQNKYQPNSVCLSGQALAVRFLPGP